jgi:hypothetical protein
MFTSGSLYSKFGSVTCLELNISAASLYFCLGYSDWLMFLA